MPRHGPARGRAAREAQGTYGGNLDCREIRAGATGGPPVESGAGLYFDRKALMGDGEIVNPPEVRALVTASAAAPCSSRVDDVAAHRDCGHADHARVGHPPRVERPTGLPRARGWVVEDTDPPRHRRRCCSGWSRMPASGHQQHRLHGVLRDAARRARALPASARARARRPRSRGRRRRRAPRGARRAG